MESRESTTDGNDPNGEASVWRLPQGVFFRVIFRLSYFLENMNRLYSVRNACMGSTDAARRAGIQHATRAIALRNAGTIAKVSASCG